MFKVKYILILIIILLIVIVSFFNLSNVKSTTQNTKSYTINQNIVVKLANNAKKNVALTFDDGPSSEITSYLVEQLNKRNVKATFFMLGNRAKNNQDLVKKIYESGHLIGSHTNEHVNLNTLSTSAAIKDINESINILEGITGSKIKYLRPPYGNYTNDLLNNCDLTFILWNIDTNDWKIRDEKKLTNYLINNIEDGSIVLMHDIYKTSVDAIINVIDELKDSYNFVTIEELAQSQNIILESHHAYRYIKKS